MAKHADSIDRAVLSRMERRPRGTAFTAADFLDLGSAAAVYQALSRNARSGRIRKVARGVYDVPATDPELGALAASTEAIAEALRGQGAIRLLPSGAHAANLLGLSTQVPVQAVYLTDGISRSVIVGRRRITLKRTTPRNMATAGSISGTVIQALRWLGRNQIDQDVVEKLRRRLSARDRRRLLDDLPYAPIWVQSVIRRVASKR